jgi:hypothetical protein
MTDHVNKPPADDGAGAEHSKPGTTQPATEPKSETEAIKRTDRTETEHTETTEKHRDAGDEDSKR